MTGAHSMIDNPEPVSLVAPPRATMTRIIPAMTYSQIATKRLELGEIARSPRGRFGKSRSSNGIQQS